MRNWDAVEQQRTFRNRPDQLSRTRSGDQHGCGPLEFAGVSSGMPGAMDGDSKQGGQGRWHKGKLPARPHQGIPRWSGGPHHSRIIEAIQPEIVVMRVVIVLSLLAAPTIAITAQSDPAPPAEAASQTSGYGAWFGSIPNMALSETGIVLNGTTDGSPAAKAGLLKGDRIVMMAGRPVANLGDMVTVLRMHTPGDTIKVVFWREPETDEKTTQVVLGIRPGR